VNWRPDERGWRVQKKGRKIKRGFILLPVGLESLEGVSSFVETNPMQQRSVRRNEADVTPEKIQTHDEEK